jgi:antitoxin component of MazEF toxin-antitoxin module
MVKTLIKHGNSLALVIDRPVLDLLQIDATTPLEIATDGNALIVCPVRDEARAARFREARAKINRKYGPLLKKLADSGE